MDIAEPSRNVERITLFLCGDVMTGRAIDHVLPHPSDPIRYQLYVNSASGYVEPAETAHGPIKNQWTTSISGAMPWQS